MQLSRHTFIRSQANRLVNATCRKAGLRSPISVRRPSVLCRAESDVSSSLEALKLRAALEAAVEREDFETAARLKKELASVQETASVGSLESQLSAAIEREDYAEAARLRDEINSMKEQQEQQVLQELMALPTKSDTTTDGVRVIIQSHLMPANAFQDGGRFQFYFAYNVRIENVSQEPDRIVKLTSRHWKIMDGTGHVQHVRGPGVVGKQPVLKPGDAFEYQSFCPLNTPLGSMMGEFDMELLDGSQEVVGTFRALIGRFALRQEADQ